MFAFELFYWPGVILIRGSICLLPEDSASDVLVAPVVWNVVLPPPQRKGTLNRRSNEQGLGA